MSKPQFKPPSAFTVIFSGLAMGLTLVYTRGDFDRFRSDTFWDELPGIIVTMGGFAVIVWALVRGCEWLIARLRRRI